MTITKQNSYLTLTGLILLIIGGFIAANPTAYLLQFSSKLSLPVSFFSELRAFGTGLLGVGLIAIVSLFIPKIRFIALAASAIVFSSFFLGRVVSMLTDGMPNQGIIIAAGIELVFSIIGLYLLNVRVKLWN